MRALLAILLLIFPLSARAGLQDDLIAGFEDRWFSTEPAAESGYTLPFMDGLALWMLAADETTADRSPSARSLIQTNAANQFARVLTGSFYCLTNATASGAFYNITPSITSTPNMAVFAVVRRGGSSTMLPIIGEATAYSGWWYNNNAFYSSFSSAQQPKHFDGLTNIGTHFIATWRNSNTVWTVFDNMWSTGTVISAAGAAFNKLGSRGASYAIGGFYEVATYTNYLPTSNDVVAFRAAMTNRCPPIGE